MQARIAPSLGALEGTHNEVWGTTDYVSQDEPTVFMGLYSLNDFNVLRNHRGKKYIFWCGSDLRHLDMHYWIDEIGEFRIDPWQITPWLKAHCEHWVENEVEADMLIKFYIEPNICPSFMGNVDDYKIEYKESDKTRYYASVSGDDFELYGWDKMEDIAFANPTTEFHLYGNKTKWLAYNKNIFVHGRIPKEQMNEEIKHMTGGLRLLEFDGFSEILSKSILWGQWPVSTIKYPHIGDRILQHSPRHPNIEGREHYLKTLNQFPWNSKL